MIANSLTKIFLVSQLPTRITPCLSTNGDKATKECPSGKDRPLLVHLDGLLYTSPCIFCITKSSANSYAVTESISLCLIRLGTNNFSSLTPRTRNSHVKNLKNLSDPLLMSVGFSSSIWILLQVNSGLISQSLFGSSNGKRYWSSGNVLVKLSHEGPVSHMLLASCKALPDLVTWSAWFFFLLENVPIDLVMGTGVYR